MDDLHISTVIAVILAMILMFIYPTYSMMEKNDRMVQNSVEYETNRFANSVESSGQISRMVYEQFLHFLDTTGYLYEVKLEHQRKIIYPEYDQLTGTTTGSYTTIYEYVYTDDIVDELFANDVYNLAYGDYLTVSVTSRSPVRSSYIVNYFLDRGSMESQKIRCSDGGMVWNESY